MDKHLQDLAWSVLPKEFKKEVKKRYKACSYITNRHAKVEVNLLEQLFGINNLTSDAEGEEMLTVSRKEVQEMYSTFEEFKEKDNTCFNLETLFGSKCLPDEKENDCVKFTKTLDDALEGETKKPLKEWLDKKSSNVDGSQPKSSESGFRLGDKVRIVNDLHHDNKYKDDITEIVYVDDDLLCPYKVDVYDEEYGGGLWYSGTDLEPYTESANKTFKIGDKVRYKGYNEIYTVEGIEEDGLALVDCDFLVDPQDLEPYTEPEEVARMKPIESEISVYLATKEEDEEFRLLLHENGFKWCSGRSLISLSCWSYDIEKSKIHFIHPDKTVTFRGKKTPGTLTFSEFKKQYFEEPSNAESSALCPKSVENLRIASEESHLRNLSQETENCDIQLDNILKDSFSKERRLNIAARVMQGVMANPYWTEKRISYAQRQNKDKEGAADEFINAIVEDVMELTDALIAEAEKEAVRPRG